MNPGGNEGVKGGENRISIIALDSQNEPRRREK
jgi:hypothetical protein